MNNLIDGRSAYSHMSEAISKDREYWEQIADQVGNTAELAGGKAKPPPLSDWSQTSNLLADLISEVSALRVITIQANSKKGSSSPEVTKVLRPVSVLGDVLKVKRYANHYKLRDRLLPHLRKEQPTEEPAAAETPKEPSPPWSASSRRRR